MIVTKETPAEEEGLYVVNMISSYNPFRSPNHEEVDRFHFTPVDGGVAIFRRVKPVGGGAVGLDAAVETGVGASGTKP